MHDDYHLFCVLFLTDIHLIRPNILLGYKLANGPDQVTEKNEININKTITKCRKTRSEVSFEIDQNNRNMQMQHT